MIGHTVVSVSAKPRLTGFLVCVRCPWCEQVHRHQWRRSDADPGIKRAPCRPRGDHGQYFVRAPDWLRGAQAADQVDRARQALRGLNLAGIHDRYLTRQILISAAALADAIAEANDGETR